MSVQETTVEVVLIGQCLKFGRDPEYTLHNIQIDPNAGFTLGKFYSNHCGFTEELM